MTEWLTHCSGWLPDDLGCTCLACMKRWQREQDVGGREGGYLACTLLLQTALVWHSLGSQCSHRCPGGVLLLFITVIVVLL